MPPRIPSLRALARPLVPLPLRLPRHSRPASILAALSDAPGALGHRIRRGRGPSSGKGKTSGRGHKGQKQHGKVPRGFQGGQTPQEVVQGKRGFDNVFTVEMSPVNLDRLQSWVRQGRLDSGKTIGMKELAESRCIHGVRRDGVKLLARVRSSLSQEDMLTVKGASELTTPLNILVARASAAAIAAVEAAGGTVTTRYYTPFAVRRVLLGEAPAGPTDEADKFRYRLPDPVARKDIEYYRDARHRGYLAHTVPEGEGPSLFFKAPGTGRGRGRFIRKRSAGAGVDAGAGAVQKGENRIW
ncbi:MAG: YmL10 [Thelocarpon impressellum]|nr:MAG: YmL10 [Thelocarpon impressellum]